MVTFLIVVLIIAIGAVREFYQYYQTNKQQKELIEERKKVILKAIKELKSSVEDDMNRKREEEEVMNRVVNEKSLTDLLVTEAVEADYKEYIAVLVGWIKDLYTNYDFQLLKPAPEDKNSGYAVMFQLFRGEKPEVFEQLFKLAIDRGLTDEAINKEFMKEIKAGEVVDLGDAIISIEGTGASSILRGEDIQVFISYETEAYKAEREEQERQDEAERKLFATKQDEYRKNQIEIQQILTEASAVLRQMTEKQLEDNPEFVEQVKKVKELY